MKKIIEFEGFADLKSGWEFDMPIVMVSPKRLMGSYGNMGGVEEMIEDYILHLSLGENPKNDSDLKKSLVEADLARAKKGSKRFKHWTATVEYDPNNEDMPFIFLKKKGFR